MRRCGPNRLWTRAARQLAAQGQPSLRLDVHDVGHTYEPVKEGMVFTVEPGIYIREEKLGVRIEDDILIGKDANINLFANIPVEVDEIETIMNG